VICVVYHKGPKWSVGTVVVCYSKTKNSQCILSFRCLCLQKYSRTRA